MNRRAFLTTSLHMGLAASLLGAQQRPARIVLRSSWQTVNIGDIAHTPGVLRLLEQHLPDVEVRLWPSKVDRGVDAMLRKRFPKITLVQGAAAIQQAFRECDFLLHGSGPSLVAEKDVARWKEETGKPYGVYGITLPSYASQAAVSINAPSPRAIELLSHAEFAFFRDSVSLQVAKDAGCTCPVMEFGPDGAFAVDVRDDQAATQFLRAHQLEEKKFLCCIPRLRFTPYWLVHPGRAKDPQREQRNEEMKEHDHRPLREAITAVVRETDKKILLCPEDMTQMAVGKEMLFDPLPNDVKQRVVWRDQFWLTDEALSTYVRSAGLFGLEMHSPIMCIGNGVPALVGRFAEQTNKGFMWRDIGLADWLFDMDQPADVARLTPTVLSLATDPEGARAKAAEARRRVARRQQETMAALQRSLARIESAPAEE